MPSTSVTTNRTSTLDTELFLRLWDREQMTPSLARHLLKMNFSDEDAGRMDELADKNQEGEITPAELEELDNFVRVGTVLSILQSRARKLLGRTGGSGNERA